MPPAIIAAAIAVGATAAATAGYIAMTTALYITIAATVAGALLSKSSVPAIGAYTSQQERKQVLRSSTASQVWLYGKSVVSGLLFFAEEQAGDQDNGEWVHLAIALTGHPIQGVNRIWLGEDLIDTFGGTSVTWEVHNDRQTADPFMLANCPSWKPDMIGRGICWLRLSLKFDQEKFPAGIPNVKVEIMGKKCYDPRDGITKWTDNAALCIRDYYHTVLGVPDSELDDALFIAGANICEERVITATGDEQRYSVNGAFDISDAAAAVLDDMHLSCAGEPTYFAGKHGVMVGAYYGPATMVLDDSQIIGDVKITPETSYSDKVNIIGGTFVDASQLYVEADFPPVVIQQWIDEDGNEFRQDVKYRFVTSEYQSQRLAQITLARKRLGRTVELTLNMFGYRYRPGYYVKLNIAVLGIVNKEFRVTKWALSPNNGCTVTLREETADVWLDAVGQPIDRPDLTTLPSGKVPTPYNLAYEVLEIGDAVQGVLSWENAGQIVYNNVIIRQNGLIVYTVQVPGTSVRLTGLPRGTYTAGVVAVTALGGKSSEGYLEFNIQAPAKPTGCEVQNGFFAITLIPRSSDISEVSTTYDFWTSGETRLPNADTATVENQASHAGQGRQWSDSQLLNEHTYYWYVRAVNAFGASEFLEVPALVTADLSDLYDFISDEIQKSTAFEQIKAPVQASVEAQLEEALSRGAEIKRNYVMNGLVKAQVIQITTTVAEVNEAFAQFQTLVNTELGEMNSTVDSLMTSFTDLEQSYAVFQQQVNSNLGSLNAVVETKMTSQVTSNGTAKASWALNLGITRNGVYYGAGMAMSIEPSGNSYKTTTVFKTDQLGIYSGGDPGSYKLAFAVYNGQVFIDDAMIRNASITSAKIANAAINRLQINDVIQSDNYVPNQTGIQLNFATGMFYMNGNIGGQGRLVLANNRIVFYNTNGQPVAVMGQAL